MFSRKLLIIVSLIVFLLSLTSARNIAYAQDSHRYGGASFGDGSASGFDDLPTTTIYLGYRFTDRVASEIAFVNMGEFSHGKGMDSIALDLSLLGLKPVGDSAEVYYKVGVHIWNKDDNLVNDERSSSSLIGVGANKFFGQTLGARLELVSYFSFDDEVEDAGILNLGLYANF